MKLRFAGLLILAILAPGATLASSQSPAPEDQDALPPATAAQQRERAIQALVSLCQRLDIQTIDLDWTAEERTSWLAEGKLGNGQGPIELMVDSVVDANRVNFYNAAQQLADIQKLSHALWTAWHFRFAPSSYVQDSGDPKPVPPSWDGNEAELDLKGIDFTAVEETHIALLTTAAASCQNTLNM